MRHFYFRFILGVVFVICAIYSFITANIPFALMYVVLSGVFLYSACSLAAAALYLCFADAYDFYSTAAARKSVRHTGRTGSVFAYLITRR